MNKDDKAEFSFDDHFYGTATVGERGQIVIPAEARKRHDIETGDKLLIMGTPDKKHLMLFKIDAVREIVSIFQQGLQRVEQEAAQSERANRDAAPDKADEGNS